MTDAGAAALRHVALEPADEPGVVVGIDEDLDVHQPRSAASV